MKPNNDGEPRKRSRLTRQACDSCAKKKRQCTGDTPCQRCKRTGIECIYSVKAIGRKRSGDGGEGGKKVSSRTKSAPPASPSPASSTTTFASATALPGPATQVSCGTGLGGLDESRYLSIFLVECCPMYPCADDASIRDGLMHEFVGLANRDSQEALQGAEAMRGQALSCSLFSCVALGGLISGCSPAAVAPHMTTARACVAKFGGLSDRYAVSALILYAMASEYVGGQGPGTEYARGMEAARAIFEGLPAKDKDPVLSAVLAHFIVLEGLPLLRLVETTVPTTNPHRCNSGGVGGGMGGAPVGWSTGGSNRAPLGGGGVHHGGGGGGGGRERNSGTSYVCCNTAHEEATFQRALAIRADVSMVSSQNPPPVYVVADAQLLTIRFSRDRGDVATRLWHLHDFATSELRRFRQEGKGAVALLALIGPLIGVQIRLGRLDGILATAELASSLIRKCPGLVRIYHRHVAHLSMAVFRLYGRRDAYDALRNLLANTIQQDTPAFEDMSPSTSRFCDLPMCASHLRKLLKMRAPRPADGSGGGGGSTATTGAGSSGGHNDSSGSYPVMSAAHGGVGCGDGAGAGAAPRQRSEGDFLVPPSTPPFRDRGQQVEQLPRRRYSHGVGTAVADVRPGLPLPAAGWSYLDYNKGAVSRPPSASASASASAAPRTAPHEASRSSFQRPPLPPFGALPPLPPPSQPQPQPGGGAEGLSGAPVPAPAASSYELSAATAYGGATAVGSAAAPASELFDTVGFEEAARRDQTAAAAPVWGTVSPAWGGGRFQSPAAGEQLRRGGDAGGGGGGGGGGVGGGGGGGPWELSTHGGEGQHGRDGRGLAPGAPPPSSAAHVTTSGAELSAAHGQKNVDHQSAITAADLQSVSHAVAGADGDTRSSANAGRPQLPDL